MSKSVLRSNKTCENCGQHVEVRFCSTCGQENVETKKSFHYLFTHFIEDLVHYDNGFWKAMKYLLVAPVILTRTYLEGKRKRFVVPVKLFIFINFVVFLGLGILENHDKETKEVVQIKSTNETNQIKKEIASIKQDSLKKTAKAEMSEEIGFLDIGKKIESLRAKHGEEEFNTLFIEKIKQYFPKLLILYMPLFAFLLWLFHDKKRWWYFDHGIFTFHYFSSMLLILLISRVFEFTFEKLGLLSVSNFIEFAAFMYIIYLFFKSHRLMYLEKRWISNLKAIALLLINTFFMLIWMIILLFISINTIH